MKQTIYLVADRYGVKRMTKSLPSMGRGEIPIKLDIEVADTAYREPVITKKVVIEDWREGIDFGDVELTESTITESEAQLIRDARMKALTATLEAKGYKITPPEA